MNTKELYTELEKAGWSLASSSGNTGVSWYAYRRLIGGKDCHCNEKPPSVCIEPYDLTFGEQQFQSVEISVRGQQANGRWVDFKVYGMSYEEAISDSAKHIASLLMAWNAVADM